MKTREEFVEELATVMCEEFGTEACEEYCGSNVCANRFIAEKLYDAGYRKQSDTVREFVKRIKEVYDEQDRLYRDYDIIDLWTAIIHLAEEYEAEVEE